MNREDLLTALPAITIGIDPTIEIGPVTLAWHGLTIALGILAGAAVAARDLHRTRTRYRALVRTRSMRDRRALGGGRVFYLAEHGELMHPSAWLGTRGFAFNGGLIAAAAATAIYVWRRRGVDPVSAKPSPPQ